MRWRPIRARRTIRVAPLVIIVAALAVAFVPTASESSSQSRLFAFVVPTTRGPLPACLPDGSNCAQANRVASFIYITNASRLMDAPTLPSTRASLPNAYVVSSIDFAVFVNGVHVPAFDGAFTPPPDAFIPAASGHWPSTVTCPGQPGSFTKPCNLVGSPAIVPGENGAIFYAGWIHTSSEPNGAYVFKFTVHGTVNGTPVDITASSPPIQMTD